MWFIHDFCKNFTLCFLLFYNFYHTYCFLIHFFFLFSAGSKKWRLETLEVDPIADSTTVYDKLSGYSTFTPISSTVIRADEEATNVITSTLDLDLATTNG